MTAAAVVTSGTLRRAVTGLAVRQVRRGALIVCVLAAGMSAVVVTTYRSTVGDSLDAAALAALAANPAIRVMFGEPVALDDAGGFAVWRTGTPLAVLLAVWAMLTATRVMRGEEDAGRWDLLLAGRMPLTAVVSRHVAVIAAASAVTGAAVAAALIGSGTTVSGAVVHGVGLALTGILFAAAGAISAQVFASRAAASGAVAAVLGVCLLIRMVGDGVEALAGLRWVSPFGLLALTRPFDANRVMPLLVLGVFAAVSAVAAALLAGRRDVRGALVVGSTGRAPRLWLLGSVQAFAVRTVLGPLVGWSVGVGAYFLLIGLLTVSMTGFLVDNPRFADLAAQAGFAGLGRVGGYLASLFALLAIPAGLFTAVRIAGLAADEGDRRLTLLLAQPVTRLRLLAAQTAAAAGAALVLITVAGAAAWLGAGVAGAALGVGAALAGVWNVLPIVLLSLGAAVFALGVAPRAVTVVGAVPATGGFLVHVVAASTGAPRWLGQLSPFFHLAPVPDASANWLAAAVMTAIAAVLAAGGAVAYRRRDMRG